MDTLSAYLPIDRRHALATGQALPDRSTGAVLFADVSGFTALTKALAEELGPTRGAEEVTRQLDRVYGALIAQVERYRGSVIEFAGDAITCWLDGDGGLRAIACALAMQASMRRFAAIRTPGGTPIELAIKVSAVSGPVRRFLVGDPSVRYIEVLAGRTLDRIAAAEHVIHKGEVVLSEEIARAAGSRVTVVEWRTSELTGERFAVAAALADPVEAAPWPALPIPDEVARAWLQRSVYERLRTGQGQFLAELRSAVALFVKFAGIDYDGDDEAGHKLDAFIRWVQSVIDHYDGTPLQLSIGDKGSYLYAAFGAPVAHEDDPARGVAAAVALRTPPPDLGYIRDICIGLSRGPMRTGAYGGPTRRTYGVLGSEANVAARLMTLARSGQILVTERIVDSASGFAFNPIGRLSLKGLSQPLPVFEVTGRRAESTAVPRWQAPMVGRDAERRLLGECLRELAEAGVGGVVIIEAEAGMGKSRLVADVLDQAASRDVRVLFGAADAIEHATPYFAWRAIFNRALGLDGIAAASERRAHVLALLDGQAALLPWAPLLSELLQLDLPDNDITAQMTGQVRADNVHRLLADVLTLAVQDDPQQRPLLLIFEDAHWLDSSSWALIPQVLPHIQPSLIVIATRPLTEPVPPEVTRLLAQERGQHVRLETLSLADIDALVCQRLGTVSLPQPVSDFIRAQAEGHPFFSEELAYALRDAGVIQVEDGVCRLAPGVTDLRTLDFPTTIQGVITSRIDALPPQTQLAVKVASIIGRIFAFQVLRDIYPVETDRDRLDDYLGIATRLDITHLDTPEPHLAYIFKHIITQEVAYNLLLFTQRHQLHRAVAGWYERTHAGNLSPYYALLAYHWSKAAEGDEAPPFVRFKAIDYLDAAGEQALRNSAYKEAIEFFGQALRLEAGLPGGAGGLDSAAQVRRRAHRYLRLGEAQRSWGHLSESRASFERAAALNGYPPPDSTGGLVIRLLGQIARQGLHRLRPARYVGRAPEDMKVTLRETSLSYQYASEVFYFTNEGLLSLYSSILSLNLSEAAGPSVELAEAYAVMGVIAEAIGLRRAARAYQQRALDTAQHTRQSLALARVRHLLGLYYLETAQWEQAEEVLLQAIGTLEELGDKRYWGDAVTMLASKASFTGELERAIQLYATLSGPQSKTLIHRTISAVWQGRVKMLQGQFDEAIASLDAALELSADAVDPLTMVHAKISAWGFLAGAHLRHADLQQARRAAETTDALMAEIKASVLQLHLPSVYVVEVYLALWAAADDFTAAERKRFAEKARRMCRGLRMTRYAARARALRCQGLYEWQAGRPAKAQQAWRQSLELAERLRMPFELAQAHYDIGSRLAEGDPARLTHLTQARDIFARIGAQYDRALAEKALGQTAASNT